MKGIVRTISNTKLEFQFTIDQTPIEILKVL